MEWTPSLLGSPNVWGWMKITARDGSHKQLKATFDFWVVFIMTLKIILPSVGWSKGGKEADSSISEFSDDTDFVNRRKCGKN